MSYAKQVFVRPPKHRALRPCHELDPDQHINDNLRKSPDRKQLPFLFLVAFP